MEYAEILRFIKALKENNSKVWMDANREWYNNVRDAFKVKVASLQKDIAKIDPEIEEVPLKDMIYRINRNNRFNRDLPPYKEYLSVTFSKGGKKSKFAEYYMHLAPDGESIIGGGIWGPEPENLMKIRQEIDYNSSPFLSFTNNKKVKEFFGTFHQKDALKTAPKGFSKTHENITYLRLKHFCVFHHFTDKEVVSKDFERKILEGCNLVQPLVRYLNEAVE